jgi:hypothetical protein
MRRILPLLLFLALLLAAIPGTALPDSGTSPGTTTGTTAGTTEAAREDPVRCNQRLLEKWRADPDHNARLERDLAAWRAMPAERRALLRKLDHDLHQQDSATQQRLWGVLERYHAWLRRLPESDRRRLREAADGPARLRLVKELREKEWIGRQPEPVRKELMKLAPASRSREVARLREEQRQRYRLALETPLKQPRPAQPMRLSEFTPDVQAYVRGSLWHLLTAEERKRLEQADGTPWPIYARTLAELAERHPIPLPGPIGPVRLADMPTQFRENVRKYPRWESQLKKAEGKWPEFGVALQNSPRRNPLRTPRTPVWVTKQLSDFSPALQAFVTTGALGKKLTESDKRELKEAEGKWPQFPQALLRLAKKYKLALPGMVLPGPRDLWERARTALPELPDRTLFHFVMNEMSTEERKGLQLQQGDPAARERAKKAYFKKHPRELKRLQHLDYHAHPHNSKSKKRVD